MIFKIMFQKVYDFIGSFFIFISSIFLILFFSISMIIRIFWSPIENVMWFMLPVTIAVLVYYYRPSNASRKMDSIRHNINKKNYKKALKKINAFSPTDFPKVRSKQKSIMEYKCILLKGLCLLNLGYVTENIEDLKKSITSSNLALETAFKRNFIDAISTPILNLATAYFHLGRLENNVNHLETALTHLEEALKYYENNDKCILATIHLTKAHTYTLLSDFYNKEGYLEEALKALNCSYNIAFEMDLSNDTPYIISFMGLVYKKLYELNHDEQYKIKAIKSLNDSINHYTDNTTLNTYTKRYYYPNYILVKFNIGTSYFYLFELTNSKEDLKNCKEALQEASIYYNKKKLNFYTSEINKIFDKLKERD